MYFQTLRKIIIIMNFTTLNHTKPNNQLRTQSKQEFFAVKKAVKRLKISNIFSEPPELNYQQQYQTTSNGKGWAFSTCVEKEGREELASTIASANFLTFRSKQPKRKKNKQSKVQNGVSAEQDSASDSEQYLHPSQSESPKVTSLKQLNKERNKCHFSSDQFLLLSKIGEGTYSQVFRAVQRLTGFICAVKILNKQKMRSLKVQESIFRQIKIQSFANHPHITKLYGFFSDSHSIYLISQYSTDHNLYEHLQISKQYGKMGLSGDASILVGQICSALAYLHSHFIIHRDIKPENMIVTYNDTVKLCDFGWSIYNPRKQLRSTLCGTPLYLAPELICEDLYNQSVDVWALGVLTYQLLTGQIPFKIRSVRDLKKVMIAEVKYTKINDPIAIEFIQSALQKDQSKRKDIHQLLSHPFLAEFHQYFKL